MKSDADPLRQEAENRAAGLQKERDAAAAVERARREKTLQRDKDRAATAAAHGASSGEANAQFARVAASDYNHNNHRSGIDSSGQPFLEPRWQPDEETNNCTKCHREFDFFWHRKHHCRHCGFIFCDGCSKQLALLPVAFNQTNPQRVCNACYTTLEPHQSQLADLIANAEKSNTIDTSEGSLMRYCNLPFSLTLGSEIRKASYSLHNMFESDWLEDKEIPSRLLADAKGIAFLTIIKAGVVLAPKVGTGLVLAKLPNGTWSPPSAIATVGLSWGLLAGADVTDFVIILNTTEAVKAFSGIGNIQIGAGVDVALGPVGRGVAGGVGVSNESYAPALSYSHSKGLFAGLSLDGSLIMTRSDVNFKFYGRQHDPMELLFGNVQQPKAAEPLYSAIMKHILLPGQGGAAGDNDNEVGVPYNTNNNATAPAIAVRGTLVNQSAQGRLEGSREGNQQTNRGGRSQQQQQQQQQYDTSFFDDNDSNVNSSINI